MQYMNSVLTSATVLILGAGALSGCIYPDDSFEGYGDPFEGYHDELLGQSNNLVRVATYYDPEFTEAEWKGAAEAFGFQRGSPANAGRWASAQIRVYGNDNQGESDTYSVGGNGSGVGSSSGTCIDVSPGSLLDLPKTEYETYCLTLNEDENARTHFFLPGNSSVEVRFRIAGLASEMSSYSKEGCQGPRYHVGRGTLGDLDVDPIPGTLVIDRDRDVVIHFGIHCGW